MIDATNVKLTVVEPAKLSPEGRDRLPRASRLLQEGNDRCWEAVWEIGRAHDEDFSLTQAETAQTIGRSQQQVSRYLRMYAKELSTRPEYLVPGVSFDEAYRMIDGIAEVPKAKEPKRERNVAKEALAAIEQGQRWTAPRRPRARYGEGHDEYLKSLKRTPLEDVRSALHSLRRAGARNRSPISDAESFKADRKRRRAALDTLSQAITATTGQVGESTEDHRARPE